MNDAANGPLAGMRVVDLTRILAGPLCTMMLGDMGADVIKVEPPDKGDDTRGWGPPFIAGEAAYFIGVNRNKRSLTLNMAVPAGQKILARLVEKADVLIDNFRIGTLEKWGFTDAWFEQHAPRLVRCSITGYGSTGPKAALPGYDFILQAESGLMSICGAPDGAPTKYGVAIVDETSLAMLINVASNYLTAGRNGGRFGNGHPSIVPYTTYQTADAMVAIGIGNERQFARTAEVLGHPEWAQDARFTSNRARVENRDLIDGLINEALSHGGAESWLDKLKAVGVPCGRINSVADALDDPHTVARDMIETVEHSTIGALKMLGIPFKFSDTACSVRRAPPTLGQHSDEILAGELGLDAKAIAELRQAKVI
jgi:crotonobetainyl-CoA:carnitine CoA-transferase CaiB-like acyl-CoA transferase